MSAQAEYDAICERLHADCARHPAAAIKLLEEDLAMRKTAFMKLWARQWKLPRVILALIAEYAVCIIGAKSMAQIAHQMPKDRWMRRVIKFARGGILVAEYVPYARDCICYLTAVEIMLVRRGGAHLLCSKHCAWACCTRVYKCGMDTVSAVARWGREHTR